VQTTLLGFAITIILVLLTALVAPLFVDWTAYRTEFEARASRLTGLDLHVTGGIEARLLPTPTLVLRGIEVAGAGDPATLRARALRIEFGLGALARGEWRITDAYLEAPEFAAGVDAAGQLVWSAPRVGFNPEGVSVERLNVEDGRIIVLDARNGARLVLEKVEFRGEMRSLSGPVKGDGSFVVGGHHFPYRLATTRIEDGSGARLRLAVDPIDRPLAAEADISISLERGTPRFEGNIQLAHSVGRAPVGSQSPIIEPWRLTSHVKGDSSVAAFDQVEFQYGPDERPIKVRGSARLEFGREPRLDAAVSSPQIDLDRVLEPPDPAQRRPLAAVTALVEALSGRLPFPVPASLSVAVESVTLRGAVLQRIAAVLETSGDRLEVKALEFRAPGVTQVGLVGTIGIASSGMRFTGSSKIESSDPRALVAWLADRADALAAAPDPLRLSADLTLSDDLVAAEHLVLDFGRMNVAGRLSYSWGRGDRPARFDAALSAPDVDVDRLVALAKPMLGGTFSAWPREGALSLRIDRASVLGLQARQANVNVRLDGNGLDIDPLMIADFGGAALAIRGRIDTRTQSPRGTVTLDLDARSLDGVLAVLERVAPERADELRRSADRLTPVLLRASLTMDPGAVGNSLASAKLKADGRAGQLRVALLADASSASGVLKKDKLAAFAAAKVNLMARVDADDARALIDLARLDRFVAVDAQPGRFTVAAKGALDSDVDVDARMTAGPLAISGSGKVRISPRDSPRAELNLELSNVNIRSPRPVRPGQAAELLPVSLSTRFAFANAVIRLTDLRGNVAGAAVRGQLALGMQEPMTVDGQIDVAALDLVRAVAMAAGIPAHVGAAEGPIAWAGEPFEQLLGPLSGQVALASARVRLTPKLDVQAFKGVIRFGEKRIALQASEGMIAGGQVSGELVLLREREGVIARSRLAVAGANAAELLPGDGTISGRLRLDLAAEGSGMSAMALVGSLEGGGTFTLDDARIARLDPSAFERTVHAVDQGLPIDTNRLRDRMNMLLASGSLAVPRVEGTITISAGQARLSNSMAGERRSELSLTGRLGLTDGDVDARLVLSVSAASAGGVGASSPPEIVVALKGPFTAPTRSVDVAAFASWLALRAVEQQSRKLDALEGRESSPAAPADQRPPEQAAVQGTHADRAPPPSPKAAPAAAEGPRPRTPARSARKPKPSVSQSAQPRPPADLRSDPLPPSLFFGVH
jgi:uncharacterized protein involved in outer membrane biogenesis